MNYRHLYHAGNFADVFKHIVLIELIKQLQRKASGITILDTHAGLGAYDLQSDAAIKTAEAAAGVLSLMPSELSLPVVDQYQLLIKNFDMQKKTQLVLSNDAAIRFYPGSPSISRYLLRSNDRMVLCELHAEDVITLKKLFRNDAQVAVHHMNGYQGMKAFLPPATNRGLVLIDPAYEINHEYRDMLASLMHAWQRFAHGVFAIWYPLKKHGEAHRFVEQCREKSNRPCLQIEISPYPADGHGLYGCGMLIVNPPWQIEKVLEPAARFLSQKLGANTASYTCKLL